MLEKGQAPANLHFHSLNPHIDLEDFPTVIPVELHELPKDGLTSGQAMKSLEDGDLSMTDLHFWSGIS